MAISNIMNMNSEQPATNPEIVFFDLETTVPNRLHQRFWVLEFGAMVVCPRKLVEVESFCTLMRPGDLSVVPVRSSREGGITRDAVKRAPTFRQVADRIFKILDGRIWAGHNIQRFDNIRIKEMFDEIGRDAPRPLGMIDSLPVLTEKFGRRAGNMKMASLADYFGLGQQKHRSLDDVRMNLEVLKHCATVLFLESSLPNVIDSQWKQNCYSMTTRSKSSPVASPTSPITPELIQPTSSSSSSSGSRKSPPATPPSARQRIAPYTRSSTFGKVSIGVQNLLRKSSRGRTQLPAIATLLKHSHSVLR